MWVFDKYSRKDGLSDITCFCNTKEEAEKYFRNFARNELLKDEKLKRIFLKNYGCDTLDEVIDISLKQGELKGIVSITYIDEDDFANEFIRRECGLVHC
jgi:hypothetical protein